MANDELGIVGCGSVELALLDALFSSLAFIRPRLRSGLSLQDGLLQRERESPVLALNNLFRTFPGPYAPFRTV